MALRPGTALEPTKSPTDLPTEAAIVIAIEPTDLPTEPLIGTALEPTKSPMDP